MPLSAFYSRWSGPAVTGTAQSIISTTKTFFEGFLMNNYKFIDTNECFHFMNLVLEQDYELPSWIVPVSEDELYDHIVDLFMDEDLKEKSRKFVRKYVRNLNEEERTRIFYKNQMMEFTRRHPHIIRLYEDLFAAVKNYPLADKEEDIPISMAGDFTGEPKERVKAYNAFVNKEGFINPNDPPDSIINILKELNGYYSTCVYMPFMALDRIYRLKYFYRKTVCIVDTDSNILALDPWVEFFEDEVLQGKTYGRTDEENHFIMVNSLAYFITSAVSDTLDQYGRHSNIPDEFRPRFNMKNEFEVKLIKNFSNCGKLLIDYIYQTIVAILWWQWVIPKVW
jgi:hypothetical protein